MAPARCSRSSHWPPDDRASHTRRPRGGRSARGTPRPRPPYSSSWSHPTGDGSAWASPISRPAVPTGHETARRPRAWGTSARSADRYLGCPEASEPVGSLVPLSRRRQGKEVYQTVDPLLAYLDDAGLGHLPEIADADPP